MKFLFCIPAPWNLLLKNVSDNKTFLQRNDNYLFEVSLDMLYIENNVYGFAFFFFELALIILEKLLRNN